MLFPQGPGAERQGVDRGDRLDAKRWEERLLWTLGHGYKTRWGFLESKGKDPGSGFPGVNVVKAKFPFSCRSHGFRLVPQTHPPALVTLREHGPLCTVLFMSKQQQQLFGRRTAEQNQVSYGTPAAVLIAAVQGVQFPGLSV